VLVRKNKPFKPGGPDPFPKKGGAPYPKGPGALRGMPYLPGTRRGGPTMGRCKKAAVFYRLFVSSGGHRAFQKLSGAQGNGLERVGAAGPGQTIRGGQALRATRGGPRSPVYLQGGGARGSKGRGVPVFSPDPKKAEGGGGGGGPNDGGLDPGGGVFSFRGPHWQNPDGRPPKGCRGKGKKKGGGGGGPAGRLLFLRVRDSGLWPGPPGHGGQAQGRLGASFPRRHSQRQTRGGPFGGGGGLGHGALPPSGPGGKTKRRAFSGKKKPTTGGGTGGGPPLRAAQATGGVTAGGGGGGNRLAHGGRGGGPGDPRTRGGAHSGAGSMGVYFWPGKGGETGAAPGTHGARPPTPQGWTGFGLPGGGLGDGGGGRQHRPWGHGHKGAPGAKTGGGRTAQKRGPGGSLRALSEKNSFSGRGPRPTGRAGSGFHHFCKLGRGKGGPFFLGGEGGGPGGGGAGGGRPGRGGPVFLSQRASGGGRGPFEFIFFRRGGQGGAGRGTGGGGPIRGRPGGGGLSVFPGAQGGVLGR